MAVLLEKCLEGFYILNLNPCYNSYFAWLIPNEKAPGLAGLWLCTRQPRYPIKPGSMTCLERAGGTGEVGYQGLELGVIRVGCLMVTRALGLICRYLARVSSASVLVRPGWMMGSRNRTAHLLVTPRRGEIHPHIRHLAGNHRISAPTHLRWYRSGMARCGSGSGLQPASQICSGAVRMVSGYCHTAGSAAGQPVWRLCGPAYQSSCLHPPSFLQIFAVVQVNLGTFTQFMQQIQSQLESAFGSASCLVCCSYIPSILILPSVRPAARLVHHPQALGVEGMRQRGDLRRWALG